VAYAISGGIRMNHKNKHTLIISTIVCIILSLTTLVISKIKGSNTNMYILLYVTAILLNIVLNLGLSIEVASTNGAKSLVFLGKWIMPVTGVVHLIPQLCSLAFPEQDIMESFICIFVGIMLVISGNYFPKNHINPYVGLKFPWILNDEENWYKTHKLGSYTWLLSGLAFILHPLHKLVFVTVPLIILLVGVVPLTYSLFLYFKRKKNSNIIEKTNNPLLK